ncbi:GrpB family protein [Salinibacillus xinjiangensis]|uniref:GrpB family protein n=1 Tax=Salinibacillus xinjiangensis TaxID=1229268 RepID=A0A6G1X8E0_9BACI|nr:GrpB family protein [Salinibacillus xinjiangensis]MRG87199.1 GrpB family protein [Salinibacillus xinjiangensis]
MTKPIVNLEKYNPDWPKQYEYEKKRILDAVGDNVLGIEHIGSTSINGLEAKPIIDILLGVHKLDEVPRLIRPLSEVNYEYVPKLELKDRRFFRKGLWGQGTCHLHIVEYNSNEWMDKLQFRDYLRTHPEAAVEYASLKKELATKYKYDRPTYTQKKEPFIHRILQKTKKE